VLIPQNHPRIHLKNIGNELEVAFGSRRWVLPNDDCLLLPVANTTDEMLAQYLAGGYPRLYRLEIFLCPRELRWKSGKAADLRPYTSLAAMNKRLSQSPLSLWERARVMAESP